MRLVLVFAVAAILTGCAGRGVSFVVVQNGLEVQATVHRQSADRNKRVFTFAVRDANSKKPVTDATVGIAPVGAPSREALNEGNGAYEFALDEPPGSSADVNVAVLAGHRSVIFELKRP